MRTVSPVSCSRLLVIELVKLFARVGVPLNSSKKSTDSSALYRSGPPPQTDSLVERFNHTLKSMLRKTATTEGKNWDEFLPYLLFAYREVPQASTGFSPFELLYGRQVRGHPQGLLDGKPQVVRECSFICASDAGLRELLRVNLEQAQVSQKSWYNKSARNRQFEPGD